MHSPAMPYADVYAYDKASSSNVKAYPIKATPTNTTGNYSNVYKDNYTWCAIAIAIAKTSAPRMWKNKITLLPQASSILSQS